MHFSKLNLLLVPIFLVALSCNQGNNKKFKESFYQKTEQQWLTVLNKLGLEQKNLDNHIVIVIQTSVCAPCLSELTWWNNYSMSKSNEANVILVVIDNYKSTIKSFLETQKIRIRALQDSSGYLLKNDYIPTTPIKLLFDSKGEIIAIDNVGAEGNLKKFLSKIN